MAGVAGAGRPGLIPPDVTSAPIPTVPEFLKPNGPMPAQPDIAAQAAQAASVPAAIQANAPDPFAQALGEDAADPFASALGESDTENAAPATGDEVSLQARTSFTTSQAQKRATLVNQYGTSNVREVDGEFQFRKDKGEKWKKFDRSFWDLLKDIGGSTESTVDNPNANLDDRGFNAAADVAGLAAPAVKEAIALPGEVGAAAAAASGVGAPLAAGLAAGSRAAAGAAGELVATGLQGPLDLPSAEDVTSSESLKRAAINGTIRAATGFLGDSIASWASKKAASRLANKTVLDALPEQTVLNDVKDLANMDQAMGTLKSHGVLDPRFTLRPDQVAPTPELAGAAQQASKSSTFRDMVERQGAMVYDTALKVLSHAGNIHAGPSEASALIKTADDAAGSLIGDARATLKGSDISGPRTNAYIDSLSDSEKGIGFTNSAEGLIADKDQLARELGTTQSNSPLPDRLIKRIQDVKALFVNNGGKIDGEAATSLYTGLTREINGLKTPETFGYRNQLIQLKNSIRDDIADGIEMQTGQGSTYSGAMSKYRMFREAEGVLGKLFDDGDMTTEALSKYIFNKSPDSLNRVQTMKKLLTSQNPQAWDDLKGNFLKGLMDNAKLEGEKASRLGQYDWVKIGKQVDDLGEKVVNEIFDSPEGVKNFREFTKIAGNLKRADFDYLTGAKSLPLVKKLKESAGALINAVRHQSPGHVGEALEMWNHVAPDDLAMKYLTNGGQEEILKMVPKREQSAYKDFFAQAIQQYQGNSRRVIQSQVGGAAARSNDQEKR